MINTQSIFQQFKSEWRLACQDPEFTQYEQDEVLEKYKVYVDNDPELGDLIEEFINITR